MTHSPAPLWNEDAEQAVLAAMLIDARAVTIALERLDATAFYSERHRRLFAAMVAVAEHGATIDPLTVADRLTQIGDLARAGGKDYLGFLVDAVPTAENVAHHAGIVREWADRRALVTALEQRATELRELGADARSVREIARTTAEALLPYTVDAGDETGFQSVRHLVYSVMERLEAQAAGKIAGLLTGYARIDAETSGFRPGELVILAGAEKMGKSNAALNLCLRIAGRAVGDGGGACAYVSAEMTRDALIKRALGVLGRVEQKRMRSAAFVDTDWPNLAHAGGTLSQLPLWIDDEAEPSLADVVARATHLKAQHPELALIVVDFLQLIHAREKGLSESVELKRIAYGLKRLAKKLGVVVLAPCQVNTKEIEDAKDPRPRLKDLQGSSGMRQAADFLVLLYRPSFYDSLSANPYEMEWNFATAREAAPFMVRLRWDPVTLRIEDFPRVPPAQPYSNPSSPRSAA